MSQLFTANANRFSYLDLKLITLISLCGASIVSLYFERVSLVQWKFLWIAFAVSYYFLHLFIYSMDTHANSTVACRLIDLSADYGEQLATLRALLHDWEIEELFLDFWSIKSIQERLKVLIEEENYLELKTHVDRLRKLSRQFDKTMTALESSWYFRLAEVLERILSYLDPNSKFFQFRMGSRTSEFLLDLMFPDEILFNLITTERRLSRNFRSLAESFRKWESSEEAKELIEQSEAVTSSILHVMKKLPIGTLLPNFDLHAVVVYWNLEVPGIKTGDALGQPPTEFALEDPIFESSLIQPPSESVLNQYQRTKVGQKEVAPGGRYRAVCRVSVERKDKSGNISRCYGTGWLIDNSTVVTAAHNVYQVGNSCARRVIVRIGITDNNIQGSTVETEVGQSVAIHFGYFAAAQHVNDFAIIKLSTPFKNVQAISWEVAPLVGANDFLRVVGYPSDLTNRSKSKGCVMYKSHGAVSYDLKDADYMLEHTLDTYNGTSGAPIFKVDKKGDFRAIGVHCYGRGQGNSNSGCPLGHKANNVPAFIIAMRIGGNGSVSSQDKGASIVDVQGDFIGMKKITVPLTLTKP